MYEDHVSCILHPNIYIDYTQHNNIKVQDRINVHMQNMGLQV